ncbi:MAG: type II secretion system protein GspE, partial [Proteobacteria bacterium]|nr:type II secretion system protein GspE [Pseudomonadota bacterium]
SSINAILAQRLVRIICPHCKEAYTPEKEAWLKLGITPGTTIQEAYRGKGCAKCHHTGYKGRCGIFELLLMDREMKHLILTTANADEIKEQAIRNGMITLRQDGAMKVLQGITTIEEVFRVSKE